MTQVADPNGGGADAEPSGGGDGGGGGGDVDRWAPAADDGAAHLKGAFVPETLSSARYIPLQYVTLRSRSRLRYVTFTFTFTLRYVTLRRTRCPRPRDAQQRAIAYYAV